jgi:hypothetical protein
MRFEDLLASVTTKLTVACDVGVTLKIEAIGYSETLVTFY